MNEGLKSARFLMVLSSISPLFILWAIRGNPLIPDRFFLALCAMMVAVPYGFLWLRIQTAKKLGEKRELVTGRTEDHRDHLLVYLFAMMLPFYTVDLSSWRDFATAMTALGFIAFLFWHLNLHYMNLIFAGFGFRVFTVYPPADRNNLSGNQSWVLISRRVHLPEGEKIIAYRISDTVYLEV